MDLVSQRRPPRPTTPPPSELTGAAAPPGRSGTAGTPGAPGDGPSVGGRRPAQPAGATGAAPGSLDGATGAAAQHHRVPASRPVHSRRALVITAVIAGLLGGVVGGGTIAAVTDESAQTSGPATSAEAAPTVIDPGSVADVVARVMPSVVTIDVTAGEEGGNGSGVIIRSEGYVLTNNHVISPAVAAGGQIVVTLGSDTEPRPAEVVGRDARSDLAVLRIPGVTGLTAATLGRSGSLVVGAPVIAIGAPFGLSGTVTTGIVSALDRNPSVPVDGGGASVIIGAIQIDAAINPGNSGGPLLDAAGQVVGLNTAIATVPGATTQSGSVGVGFAIPIDYAASVADEIIRTGRATHPYLGVSAATVTAAEARARGTRAGAIIREVDSTGPAAAAGLTLGDIITQVDGMAVNSTNDMTAATRLHRVGDSVTVTFWRAGAERTTRVVLQEQPG
ncbi:MULTISPECIES: S1C family serine protease [unclassified Frankia]|uniref:S1C family serine protease n=1 Tax=unclassified Frankia TaxID=2632575 RepID=UPI001F1D10EC|nr:MULTISPECIES: trypsin-like peptidase domain-containing protein [unclassified Frankia]